MQIEPKSIEKHSFPTDRAAVSNDGDILTVPISVIVAELYPGLNVRDRGEAASNLRRYFEIAFAVAEDALPSRDPLTSAESVPTMKERSNVDLKI
jgi:hypothetical protein